MRFAQSASRLGMRICAVAAMLAVEIAGRNISLRALGGRAGRARTEIQSVRPAGVEGLMRGAVCRSAITDAP
jgi:hypothetical protein